MKKSLGLLAFIAFVFVSCETEVIVPAAVTLQPNDTTAVVQSILSMENKSGTTQRFIIRVSLPESEKPHHESFCYGDQLYMGGSQQQLHFQSQIVGLRPCFLRATQHLEIKLYIGKGLHGGFRNWIHAYEYHLNQGDPID